MNLSEMRELPPTELRSEAEKIEAKIWKLRFQAKGEPIEHPGALKRLKRERARMLTVLRERELAEARAGARGSVGARWAATEASSDAQSAQGAGD